MDKAILAKLEQILLRQQVVIEMIQIFAAGVLPAANDWLDSTDVKSLLKISDRSLYRLRNKYGLPAKKIGGKWYYLRKALEQFVGKTDG